MRSLTALSLCLLLHAPAVAAPHPTASNDRSHHGSGAFSGQLDSSKNLAPVTADLIPSSCG